MTERYPDDAALLSLTEDPQTGVEYVPTGKSPYYLEFRRLMQRTLLASQRANDLRVYQDGDLTVGVRPGRCSIGGNLVDFVGATNFVVTASATSFIWMDQAGTIQISTTGFPLDTTQTVPLASVQAGVSAIDTVTDHRGESFLYRPTLNSLGLALAVTAKRDGPVSSSVTAVAGGVPFQGVVADVVLSLGGNLVSDNPADGIRAVARVNGVALTSTDPSLTSSDGSGFVSTAQGAGVPAVVKSNGDELVAKGDVLTVDLVRSATGVVSSEAVDAVVLIEVRPV